MKILTFIHHYLPGYKSGGPARTIANMANALGELQFLIVTSDRDFQDRKPYKNVSINEWNDFEKSKVFYARYRICNFFMFFKFLRIIKSTQHDVIYLNSFFDPIFTLLPLLIQKFISPGSRRVIIAPRGEFSKGALSIKRWKKIPYLLITRSLRLYEDVLWQASSEDEARDIRNTLGKVARRISNAQDIVIAQNLTVETPSINIARKDSNNGVFKVIFLSRIAKMKNLSFVLKTLARLTSPVECNIYGPIQDEPYWRKCKELINLLPKHVVVHYCGGIPPAQVSEVMSEHDLFFLPTLGENFGHVIMESLAVGTPVLISDQTPWRTDDDGACYALPLSNEMEFVKTIEHNIKLSVEQRLAVSKASIKLAKRHLTANDAISQNLKLFATACEIEFVV